MPSNSNHTASATFRNQTIELDDPVDWPEGTKLMVLPIGSARESRPIDGHVIVVGFGLAGRCVASLLGQASIPFTIVEKNPKSVATQLALGHRVIEGNACETDTLVRAGLHTASILALTIPDEAAVLKATSLARRLRPELYIIARTNYSSQGMKASQLGADDVIKAEQVVALQFYDRLSRHLRVCENS